MAAVFAVIPISTRKTGSLFNLGKTVGQNPYVWTAASHRFFILNWSLLWSSGCMPRKARSPVQISKNPVTLHVWGVKYKRWRIWTTAGWGPKRRTRWRPTYEEAEKVRDNLLADYEKRISGLVRVEKWVRFRAASDAQRTTSDHRRSRIRRLYGEDPSARIAQGLPATHSDGPGIPAKPAVIGRLEYLYSCSQAAHSWAHPG
jgi:hypothetical protein